jgi:hypothetical protein
MVLKYIFLIQGISIGFAIISYNGFIYFFYYLENIYVSFATDNQMIKNPRDLVNDFNDEYVYFKNELKFYQD